MKVLMIGVDRTSVGGMLTVVDNYLNDKSFCDYTHLEYIPSVVNSSNFQKIVFFIKALCVITWKIFIKHYDVVHIHMSTRTSVWREGIIARVSNFLGSKVLIHIHADVEPWVDSLSAKKQRLVSYLLSSADTIALLGFKWEPFIRRITKGNVKIRVLYNAVFAPDVNYYNVESKKIIFLGMLTPLKGINEILEAVLQIDSKIPQDIEFNLYGADKNHNIEELINQYGVSKRIKYCGWLTPKDKPACFKDALICLLPSYTEALPMTILETMAYGIPNIATPVGAIPEVITSGENGILIEPKSSGQLADAILSLLQSKKLLKTFSNKAFETIQNKFSIEKNLAETISLYEFMLKQ